MHGGLAPASVQRTQTPSVQRKPKDFEHREVRRIVPGTGSGPVVSSDLERLPARTGVKPPVAKPEVKSATAAQDRKPADAPVDPNARKETILYRPVADAAGMLDASGYRITLDGVSPVARDETCHASDGGTWPCGLMARTTFRAWLHGRAMTCDVPAAKGAITTSCKVGDEDPALWLVENGWARSDDPRYHDAATKAEEDKRGMFGDPPKAFSAMPAMPAPPLPTTGGDVTGGDSIGQAP